MYLSGQIVWVHRRVDPNNINGPREWAEAMIMRRGALSHNGMYSWTVAFRDRYTGPTIYQDDKISRNKPLPDLDPHADSWSFPKFRDAPAPKKVLHDNCPKCGHRGNFIGMALVCPTHGVWAGC